ncbi:MAG: acetyl/propionyl-CoA carboxylase subunit alpha [Magnetovibrio sp.]|nr:acetyl/propionyl-CoA carboxylase subunit alpha [Magnetovibrio sp.]
MFTKLLVANRGEIACRIIKTARRLGIKTVAVYSDADVNSLHKKLADESFNIGPAPSNQSYLVSSKILSAIKETGADSVHPGYGFLSENAEFAEMVTKENITFVGPSPASIRLMGDKIESKKIAHAAGVNIVPGNIGAIQSTDKAIKIANEIGYPVILKASSGGGGKGMRLASNDDECYQGLSEARNEAMSSFGDDRVFIEKFIENPRHIEIQVIADKSGQTIHLGERECSVQRRHQKVLEEAPSPFLNNELRERMASQALALAKAVNYYSAGTVEFVIDNSKNFYFLEMNTRLQVEHPVTELITGLDLVELMIRIAAGENLSIQQKNVKLNGCAIEARVYSEDPSSNFMPSVGRLVRYIPPEENNNIRLDSGVCEGDEISIFYDPMIAKLISYGETRKEALKHMRDALDAFFIRGVDHNICFLAALTGNSKFVSGEINTNLIAEEYPGGFNSQLCPNENLSLFIVCAVAIHHYFQNRAIEIPGQLINKQTNINADWIVMVNGRDYPVTVSSIDSSLTIANQDRTHTLLTEWKLGEKLLQGTFDGHEFCMQVERRGLGYHLVHGGSQYETSVFTKMESQFNKLMPSTPQLENYKQLRSPMPGLLVSMDISEGERVESGRVLAVVEAMKMENALSAERDVMIGRIYVSVGDTLEVDQVIMEFE